MVLNSMARNLILYLSVFLFVLDLEIITNAQRVNSNTNQWNNPMQHQQQQQQQHQQQQQYQSRNMSRKFTNNRNQFQQSKRRLPPNEQKQNSIRTNPEKFLHKCFIWVPSDAIHKYPHIRVEGDPQASIVQLEVCCNGFSLLVTHGKIACRPVCDNCLNGYCEAPNKCRCYNEFVKNDNDECIFACPLSCLNGQCYLDGTCQCDPGYKLDESRKYCRPICSTGCGQNPRHNCSAPELCTCVKGYQLTDEGCQPICQPECGLGGRCIEPNVCNCEVGFELKNRVCQADCYQKCDNGICYSRNRCICNPGYIYHERSTTCIPK